jgi:hypothetical protein
MFRERKREADVFHELGFSKFKKKYFGSQQTTMAMLWYR